MWARRHCYNQLLEHFEQKDVKWSKAAAYRHSINIIRPAFPWYNEVSSRVTRNAIDDLDNAFKHFFLRLRENKPANPKAKTFREKFGFPTFKKKGIGDSFALREKPKFSIDGRELRIEKLKTLIKMRQPVRFVGNLNQVTISQSAGKFYASILVETADYNPHAPEKESVGVDFGVKSLAVFSDGTEIPANNALQRNLKALKRKQRRLSRKQKGSNRRARAKFAVAKLHKRISDQRQAVLHELSDRLTRDYKVICLEDLNVSAMVRNRKLARPISDDGFGMLRRMIEYKAELRGVEVSFIGRFEPSSRTCSECGQIHDMPLDKRTMTCDCGNVMDRDLNAARNILARGLDTLRPDLKRTQEWRKTPSLLGAAAVTA